MRSFAHSLVEKSRRYSQQPDRMRLTSFTLDVEGDHGHHVVTLVAGTLLCDCDHHRHEGVCAHVLAAERVLGPYLAVQAVPVLGSADPA
jgi:hypothetical protein